MIISAASDYRAAAQRILPPFLFHYIDGGAYAEHTLRRNVEDLSDVALRQRILRNMSDLSLETTLFNEKLAMPTALAPVGLCGMYARRGEVQAAMAADKKGIPFTMSSVSVCPIEEVAPRLGRPMWFQLYVLKDRAVTTGLLTRARAAGCTTARPTAHGSGGRALQAQQRSIAVTTSTVTKDGRWTTGVSTTRAEISHPV